MPHRHDSEVAPRAHATVLAAFADAVRRRARGTLVVTTHHGDRHRIAIEHGRPIGIDLAVEVAPLTEVLGRWEELRGELDLLQVIVRSSRTTSERREALLASGAVTPARLAEAERRQALERLSFLFGLERATTTFGPPERAGFDAEVSVLPAHALLHFSRLPTSATVVTRYVHKLADLPLALDPSLDLLGLGLDEEEAGVAWQLAVEPQSARALSSSGRDRGAVFRVLFALGLSGGVVRAPSASFSSPAPRTRTPVPSKPAPSSAPSRPSSSTAPSSRPEPPRDPLPRRDRITPAAAFAEAEGAVESGHFRSATSAIDHALALDPDNPSLHAMAAYVEAHLDWPASAHADADIPAIAALTRVIEDAPTCALAYGYRGMLRARLGSLEAAATDLRDAVRINPLHAGMRRALDGIDARLGEGRHDQNERPGWWRRLLGAIVA